MDATFFLSGKNIRYTLQHTHTYQYSYKIHRLIHSNTLIVQDPFPYYTNPYHKQYVHTLITHTFFQNNKKTMQPKNYTKKTRQKIYMRNR